MVITKERRELILELSKEGRKNINIAKVLHVDRSSVGRILKLAETKGSVSPKKAPGKPRTLTEREERYAKRLVSSSDESNAKSAARLIGRLKGKKIHPNIIRRALHREGLFGRKKIVKPRMTAKQRKERLNFAKDNVQKTPDFWDHVIFSDERGFQIFPTTRGQWTWRRPNESLLPSKVIPSVKHGGGNFEHLGMHH